MEISDYYYFTMEDIPSTDFTKAELVGTTRWLKLETLTWKDRAGKEQKWDRSVRTTKKSETSTDAVSIFAVLQNGNPSQDLVVLVKQFRPPIGRFAVELPAGLIDDGESFGQAALRELKEETGYEGVVIDESPSLCMSPGMTNESIAMVTVHVDMNLEVNKRPIQQLAGNEDIQVITCKKDDLFDQLTLMAKADDVQIFTGLYFLARGLQINSTTKRQSSKRTSGSTSKWFW